MLKQKIAAAAQKKNVNVMGVCTDPLLPPYRFSPVTTAASQEIPLMTGAVDLIVTGSQFVNPSLAEVAKDWKVALVAADGLEPNADPDALARQIVEQAGKAFEMRQNITRDVPWSKSRPSWAFLPPMWTSTRLWQPWKAEKSRESQFWPEATTSNTPRTKQLVTVARQFLAHDILCISDGEASVSLAKYRLLDPARRDEHCGDGVNELLAALGGTRYRRSLIGA